MTDRYAVSVLNYQVSPDQVALLFHSKTPKELSSGLHFLQGTSASDYARRKGQEGPFWKSRAVLTLIQNEIALVECMLRMDLWPVVEQRVAHPVEWKHSGYLETAGVKKRYRVINRNALRKAIGEGQDYFAFREGYLVKVEQRLQRRDERLTLMEWKDCLAVGAEKWIGRVASTLPPNVYKIQSLSAPVPQNESSPRTLTLQASRKYKSTCLKRFVAPA